MKGSGSSLVLCSQIKSFLFEEIKGLGLVSLGSNVHDVNPELVSTVYICAFFQQFLAQLYVASKRSKVNCMKLLIFGLGENKSFKLLWPFIVLDFPEDVEGDGLDVFVAGNMEECVAFLVLELTHRHLVVLEEGVEAVEVLLLDH